ncbi:helix-turn-helix domain-containing protein [Enterobacteriaceae bacterium LUAb1]
MVKNENLLRNKIGLFLKESRKDKRLTGYQLGCLLQVSQQQISCYERGLTAINFDLLDKMLIVLDKNWLDFFFSVMVEHSAEIANIKNEEKYFLI